MPQLGRPDGLKLRNLCCTQVPPAHLADVPEVGTTNAPGNRVAQCLEQVGMSNPLRFSDQYASIDGAKALEHLVDSGFVGAPGGRAVVGDAVVPVQPYTRKIRGLRIAA